MEKLNDWLSAVEQKTDLLIEKLEALKKENSSLTSENQTLREKNAQLESEGIVQHSVHSGAPENFAKADTESIKKTIDGIVKEIDQALAVLSN
ncbi:MAG: cell division protein ZapB [Bacteroidia bacterium]|nr:cell division protein ZapB [Bacteroidia bacterium]